jgi:hypothetical protein
MKQLNFVVALMAALMSWPGSLHAGDTTKVCQLTGVQDREPPGKLTGAEISGVTGGVTGTDLGFSFEYDRKLYFLFGDSREFPVDRCEPFLCGTEQQPKPVSQPNPERVQRWRSQAEWDAFVALRGDGYDSMATAPLSFDPDQCASISFETAETGQVFAHDVDGDTIKAPFRLGVGVAANPQDKHVVAMGNRILVVTNDGQVFVHDVDGNTIKAPFRLGVGVAANPQDKWVLAMGNRILVVTNDGQHP